MGEAKRRKELGLPPRNKPIVSELPSLDKKAIQKKVRSFLYKNPFVPFAFYGLVLIRCPTRFELSQILTQQATLKERLSHNKNFT